MASPRVLILTAVFPEARAIARAFALNEILRHPLWVKHDIALAAVGLRAASLPRLSNLPELSEIQLIIMAGVAGALSPALKIGNTVVDARDEKQPLPPLGNAFLGRLYTATALVATPWQKSALFESTRCLAVDMETDIAAAFAAARRIPFLAIRGISDAADHPLDPALLSLVDAAGKPRIARALALILTHPAKLPAMLRLKKNTDRALAGVCETLHLLLASGWPADMSPPRADV